MQVSNIVAVSAVLLLLLLRLFSFVFCCETAAWASVATLWNNWLVQNKFNVHDRRVQSIHSYKNQVVRVQYTDIIVMIKVVSSIWMHILSYM